MENISTNDNKECTQTAPDINGLGQDVKTVFGGNLTGQEDARLPKIFMGLAGLLLLISIFMSVRVGINSDDSYQNDYSELVVDFYSSFGQDTSFMGYREIAKIHYYGAFFELVAGAVSSMLLTDEVVLPQEWLGGGLIVMAAWLAARIHAGDEK